MQVSSEGEMRGVGRTRPAEKAKENTEAKEDSEANEQWRMRGSMRRTSGSEWRLS